MKKFASTGLMVAALLFGTVACNQKEGAVEQAQDLNEQASENTPLEERTDDVADFMTEAASSGMLEVQAGELAQSTSQNQEVKSFGQMMVTDHTKANDELKALARQKSIVMPDSMSERHMSMVDNLRNSTGAEFDQNFADLMVTSHEEAVNLFEEAAQNVEDPDVKAFASKTLPTLQQHLDKARQLNDKLKNKQ